MASSISVYCSFIISVAQGENLGVILDLPFLFCLTLNPSGNPVGSTSKMYMDQIPSDHPHCLLSV